MRVYSPASAYPSSLITTIEQLCHVFIRRQAELIEEIFDVVGRKTLPNTLGQGLLALKNSSMPLLMKRERILISHINALESDAESCLSSAVNPIKIMRFEHIAVKLLITDICKLTMNCWIECFPDIAYAKFYVFLKELIDNLADHIYRGVDVLSSETLQRKMQDNKIYSYIFMVSV